MVDEDLGQHRHGEEQQREDTEEAVVGDQCGLAAAVVIAVLLHDRVGKAKQAVPALSGVGPRQQPGDQLTGLGGSPRPEPVKSQGRRSGRSGVRGRPMMPRFAMDTRHPILRVHTGAYYWAATGVLAVEIPDGVDSAPVNRPCLLTRFALDWRRRFKTTTGRRCVRVKDL